MVRHRDHGHAICTGSVADCVSEGIFPKQTLDLENDDVK